MALFSVNNQKIKKISSKDLNFVPASHEDYEHPSVWKKVLFTSNDISSNRRVQMINWAKLCRGKSFVSHYHEDMDEIFIILTGKIKLYLNEENEILEKGDAILIPMGTFHEMKNISDTDIEYIVIGLSLGKAGRTIKKKNI